MFRGGTCLQVLTTDSLDTEDVFLSKTGYWTFQMLADKLKTEKVTL